MNHTYQVVGSDGQVYGPVSFEELRQWAQEGRINATTQIYRSDQTAWQPASAFSELGLPETPAAVRVVTPAAVRVVTPAATTVSANPAASLVTSAAAPSPAALAPVLQQVKSGAGWFYWIAGLSLVNTIASLAGSGWGFIIGLGITQVFDAIAGAAGGGMFIAIALDAVVLGIFVLFGFLAGKCKAWAFLVGMILYALDGLIFLIMADWMATGFHVLALYFMFKGWQACRMYHRVAGL